MLEASRVTQPSRSKGLRQGQWDRSPADEGAGWEAGTARETHQTMMAPAVSLSLGRPPQAGICLPASTVAWIPAPTCSKSF